MSNALPPNPCPSRSLVHSPLQRLLRDHRRFRLEEEAWYAWCHEGDDYEALCLVVPAEFEHDFASVPRLLWALISPFDLGLASIFHDWLYRKGGRVTTLRWPKGGSEWVPVERPWTRRDADRLFARIMREQGVKKWRRRLAFQAVHQFGGDAWQGADSE